MKLFRLFHRKEESMTPAALFIGGLTLAQLVSMQFAVAKPLDDHFLFQKFIETLAGGQLDLSIPGFHGAGFFAAIWFLISQSPLANIEFQAAMSLLLPLSAFLAGRSLFKSNWHGVVLATIITLMPFVSFVYLRGWTGSSYFVFLLLAIAGLASQSRLAWIPWGFAMITKPFAIVLLPLAIAFKPKKKMRTWYAVFGLAFLIPALYVLIQYLQVGHIIVGAHENLNQSNLWQGPERIVLNLAHALQILFSVHNYYYVDPALTGAGNLLHTTPLLIFLGLFGLLTPQKYFEDKRLQLALGVGATFGILLNALLDHMDHFYMEASVLLFIIASLPVLKKHLLWIPLVIATLHFQWLYFYLQFQATFTLTSGFFVVPLFVDAALLAWCILHGQKTKELLSEFV